MNENDFILLLQKRAREHEQEMQTVPFPHMFTFIVTWLSTHPWRYLIPLAFLLSVVLYGLFGSKYVDGILWLFRNPVLAFPVI